MYVYIVPLVISSLCWQYMYVSFFVDNERCRLQLEPHQCEHPSSSIGLGHVTTTTQHVQAALPHMPAPPLSPALPLLIVLYTPLGYRQGLALKIITTYR